MLCALFAALTAVCSQVMIPLPFTPVPVNLALLAVFACGGVLGAKKGAVAMLVYILLGAIGAPVFVGFSGGIGVLAGPTGGYIVGYLPAAVIFGLLLRGRSVPSGGGAVPGAFQSPAAVDDTKRTVPAVLARRKGTALNIVFAVIRGIPAMVACYALGTAWFMALTGTGLGAALLMCVVPFVPGDILKIVAAGAVCEAVGRARNL